MSLSLRNALDRSTPGPWHTVETRDGFGNPLWHVLSGDEKTTCAVVSSGAYGESGGVHCSYDAAFICEARNRVDAVLRHVVALDTALRGAGIERNRMMQHIDALEGIMRAVGSLIEAGTPEQLYDGGGECYNLADVFNAWKAVVYK